MRRIVCAVFMVACTTSSQAQDYDAYFGDVRNEKGFVYGIKDGQPATFVGYREWGYCPDGYTLLAKNVDPDGFWLSVRNDLAGRLYYVGNVVREGGKCYRVDRAGFTYIGLEPWGYGAGQEIGRISGSDGFWIMDADVIKSHEPIIVVEKHLPPPTFPIKASKDDGFGSHWGVRSEVTLSKNGRLDGHMKLSCGNHYSGFHAATQVALCDQDGNILHKSEPRSYGIGFSPPFSPTEIRDVDWDEVVPVNVLPEVRYIVIVNRRTEIPHISDAMRRKMVEDLFNAATKAATGLIKAPASLLPD